MPINDGMESRIHEMMTLRQREIKMNIIWNDMDRMLKKEVYIKGPHTQNCFARKKSHYGS